jgi:hypothetical protein
MDINNQLTGIVEKIVEEINNNIQEQVYTLVRKTVVDYVKTIPITTLFENEFRKNLADHTFEFPESSIPGPAIDLSNFYISGDNVQGGIIKNFGSSGIDDKALTCQLSIFDAVTVVENNLVTKDLTVKGTVNIEGDLNVTGSVPESSSLFINLVNAASDNVRSKLDTVVFDSYANMVFKQIQTNGLDLTKITVNGNEIVNGPTLGNSITSSNLQKLGVLSELQVSGEALISQSLYCTNKRIGINTIEPSQALSVWDQEIEIGFGKQSSNTAVIETPRNQTLLLSSNGKNNVSLNTDGSTTVNKINMGNMSFAVGNMPPGDDQPKGSVVFHSNPSLGGPLGWVSLGNATWANFGIID